MTTTVSCPECGAANRAAAINCRLCGALLQQAYAEQPRIREKLLRRTDFIAAQRANVARTNQLVLLLLLIAAALGYVLGWNLDLFTGSPVGDAVSSQGLFSASGIKGAVLMLLISLAWTWFALTHSDSLIMHMTDGREVSALEEAQLHNVVEEMAIAAGLPKPRVFLIETDAPNAFAMGMEPKSAAIGVTRGLLTKLTRDELQGVIGHEMGHIVNWDIRYATVVTVLVGLIVLVSDAALRSLRFSGGGHRQSGGRKDAGLAMLLLIVLAVVAPLIARLVQMAVSRQREFLADATSVRLTRNPEGLIGALTKLEAMARPFEGANRATQHLFIVNPIREFSETVSGLMATHPPLERRIERLRNLGRD